MPSISDNFKKFDSLEMYILHNYYSQPRVRHLKGFNTSDNFIKFGLLERYNYFTYYLQPGLGHLKGKKSTNIFFFRIYSINMNKTGLCTFAELEIQIMTR